MGGRGHPDRESYSGARRLSSSPVQQQRNGDHGRGSDEAAATASAEGLSKRLRMEADLNELACGHGHRHRGRETLWSSVSPCSVAVPSRRVIKAPANTSLQSQSIVVP